MAFLDKYALIFHIPLAMLLVLVNESLSRHSLIDGFGFIVNHPGAYLYNSYIIYVILLLVFLSPRRLFMRLVMMAVVILFGIINCIILNNRVTPFGFTDLAMVGDLLTMQNTKYFTAQQAGISLIAILIFVFLMVMLHMRGKKQQVKTKLWVRIVVCVVGFASLIPVTRVCQNDGVVQTYFGNLAQGYLDNGYAYGFAMSVVGRGMNEPSGYSEKTVEKIVNDTEKGDSTLGKLKPNIYVVFLESCFDVE